MKSQLSIYIFLYLIIHFAMIFILGILALIELFISIFINIEINFMQMFFTSILVCTYFLFFSAILKLPIIYEKLNIYILIKKGFKIAGVTTLGILCFDLLVRWTLKS